MPRYSALARPVQLAYPTNLAIVIITGSAIVISFFWQLLIGANVLESIWWSLGFALTLFFSWALSRELDPDNDWSAFVALPAGIAGFLLFGPSAYVQLLMILLVLRMLNRTVGHVPKITDSLFIMALGLWFTMNGNYVMGVVVSLAFAWDSRLSGTNIRHLLYSMITLIAAVLSFIIQLEIPHLTLEAKEIIIVLTIAVLFGFVIIITRKIRSKSDLTDIKLKVNRVKAAQIIALFTLLTATLWFGVEGAIMLLPLWAAVIGVSFYRLFLLLTSFINN